MSTETAKPSILTDAMNRARAIKDAKAAGEDIRTPEEVAAKRLLKRAGLVAAGTIAAVVAIKFAVSKMKTEEPDDSENNDITPAE